MKMRLLVSLSLSVAFGCSGSVETIPSQGEGRGAGGSDARDDDPPGGGGASGGSGGSSVGDGGSTWVVPSSGGSAVVVPLTGGSTADGGSTGGSLVGGAAGGGAGPATGDVIGELHFSFAGDAFTNQPVGDGVHNVTIVPLPETATVTAFFGDVSIVTGVAGSMPFLLSDCQEISMGVESCTLEIVSFGATPSSSSSSGQYLYPYDGRLGSFSKQETFTTSVIRQGDAWSLPPTNLGLILEASTVQGETSNRNDTGEGPAFIVMDTETGRTQHELLIESFQIACDGDYCEVEFSAYERE